MLKKIITFQGSLDFTSKSCIPALRLQRYGYRDYKKGVGGIHRPGCLPGG